MVSAIIGCKRKGEVQAIHLDEGGELAAAGHYLMKLISQGEWMPGTEWGIVDGRDEMDSLVSGGSVKDLSSRVKSSTKSKFLDVHNMDEWKLEVGKYRHGYLFDWAIGALYYYGVSSLPGKSGHELASTLLGQK